MLADGRRAGLAGSIHLVFPFQQNAFPYPRKEAAALGKHASVTCLLPEIVMLGFWKEKISTLLGELWSVHLEKMQGMKMARMDYDPFQGPLGTVSMSSKLGKGPQLKRRK